MTLMNSFIFLLRWCDTK